MYTLSLQQLLARFAALLVIFAVHGWAVATATVALGDPGPKYDGRRTLNPFAHLDLVGALGVLLFSLGWIRPIAIDPRELRSRWAPVLVALAGIGSTIVLVLLLRLAAPLAVTQMEGSVSQGVSVFISNTIGLGLWFALFNLLPIPPLTGGLFLMAVAPRGWALGSRFQLYTTLGLVLLVVSNLASRILAPIHRWLLQIVLNL